MNLGLVAGGAADGYNTAEALKLKKLQEARAEEEHARKKAGWLADDRYAAVQTVIPGQEFDPAERDAAMKADMDRVGLPKAHGPGGKPSFMGRLARTLSGGVQPAAVASGVAAPPAPTTEASAPAAAPGLPAASAPGVEVEGMTVTAPSRKRIATIADTYEEEYKAARAAGQPRAVQLELFKKFHEASVTENVKLLAGASPPRISVALAKAGVDVDVMADPDKEGGFIAIDGQGNETKYKSRDEMAVAIKALFDGDVAGAVKANIDFRKEMRDDLEIDLRRKQLVVTAKHYANQDGVASRRLALDEDTHSIQKETLARGAQAAEFLEDENNAILYPKQWDAAAAAFTQAFPTLAKGTAKTRNPDGSEETGPTMVFSHTASQMMKRYSASPFVANQLIDFATGKDGTRGFKVKMPDGTFKGAATFDEAELLATRTYKGRMPGAGK